MKTYSQRREGSGETF